MLEALQTLALYGGAFVLVLSLVVFVHEFGHFQAARWSGVAVDTFSIGFGRTLAGWTDKSGVKWKIGALPLGGYVKFVGDADAASTRPAPQAPESEHADWAAARKAGHFHAMPVGARGFVVAAGPLANFIFSTLVFAALFFAFGKDMTDPAKLSARVDAVQAGSAAAEGGLKAGDVITAIDGRPIAAYGEVQEIVAASAGKALAVQVDRQGAPLTLQITPRPFEDMDAAGARFTRGLLGVQRATRPEERVIERLNPLQATAEGALQVWKIVATTVAYVGNIFSGKASPEHLAGPLGIMDQSGKVLEASIGVREAGVWERIGAGALGLVQWAAILSVAVGFVNLLPIPVLDGGHLAFYAVEAVRGRPLSPQAQDIGFRAGLAMIAGLFLFSTWNDLQRLNVLEFLSGMLS